MNINEKPFGSEETVTFPAVVAGYETQMPAGADPYKKAGAFAVGQTIGTWVKVPGISDAMVENYQGQVIALEALGEDRYLLKIAFPVSNFGSSLTQLMTALVGNDVSTSIKAKLIDISFLKGGQNAFTAPKKGIKELREITGVYDRPVILNMIKPCAGYTPEEGLELFRKVAGGGMDLVKDDELLGSPVYNNVADRTKLYIKTAEEIFGETGKRTVYVPNISGRPSQMKDNVRRVIDAGAKACLVNYVFGGLDTMLEINEEFGNDIFIIAHYAGLSVMESGIRNGVYLGTLARLAGAHAVMTMCPNTADKDAMEDFYNTVAKQQLEVPGLPKVVTTVGGGITPINQQWIQKALGNDVIIGIGGAVQGHPMGAAEGARTAIAAVEATAKGIALEDAAKTNPGLAKALEIWYDT